MMLPRRPIAAGLASAVALAVLLAAPAAGAAQEGHRVELSTRRVDRSTDDIKIRTGASTASQKKDMLHTGDAVIVECQIAGGRLGGASKHRDNRTWDRLVDGGYVHDMLTATTRDGERETLRDGGYVLWTMDIPRCPEPAATPTSGDVAAEWAEQQLGRVVALPDDQAIFPTWPGGPEGEWSGDSMRFVKIAWARAGAVIGSGRSVADQCAALGCMDRDGAPERGAAVFWPDAGLKGQEGISDGKGMVYTTIGADGHDVPVSQVPLDFFGEPAGWAITR